MGEAQQPAPAGGRQLVRADVAVVGGSPHAVRTARVLADRMSGRRRPGVVVLVTPEPLTAGVLGPQVTASGVLAAAAATGHTWAFGYERARTAARDAARPAALPGVTVIEGAGARITGVDGAMATVDVPATADRPAVAVTARSIVVAPTLLPATPGVTGLPDVISWRPDQVPSWETVPFSLVVLGGGGTGCELAAAFAGWGSKVTVVERADRLLPAEHPAASAAVAAHLESLGVRVLLGGTVTRVAPTLDDGVYVGTDVGGDVAATHLVLATGTRAETVPGLDRLEAAARRPRRPWAPSSWRRVTLLPPEEAIAPSVLATRPQVAHVGLAVAPEGGALTSTEVPVPGVDDGRLVLVTRGDRLRGATAVGDGAGLAIAEAALALASGVTLSDWAAVGRCAGLATAFDGHAGAGAVTVLGAAWAQAYARALGAVLD